MDPTPGSNVLYKLSEGDVQAIQASRQATGGPWPPGNEVHDGDVYPAVVVRVFTPPTCNLQVLLDGRDTYWATSRVPGDQPGQWSWPF